MSEMHSRPTQCERILHYMHTFGSITTREAVNDLGVMRLASRISELKKDGYKIEGQMVTVKNRFGEDCHVKQYRMKEDEHENA